MGAIDKCIQRPQKQESARKSDPIKYTFLRFLLSCGLFAASAVAQTPIFFDTFENGAVTNGEVIPVFWTPSSPANTTVAETGGALVITAGGLASPNGTLAPHLRSGNPSAQFNFFHGPLRFAASVAIGGTAPANQSLVRFALTGNNAANYSAEDVLAVRLQGDNRVSLSVKQDRAAISPEAVTLLINAAGVGSTVTGFELTLDATNYTLVVAHTGGAGSTAFNGAHGLIAAQWGVDGASAFQFEVVRATGAGAGAGLASVGTVDNFTVARLSSPPLVEDTFGNGVPPDSDDATGFWSTELPQTSTVAENGKLVLTASSPTTGNIRASHASGLGSNMNFFGRQIRVGAELAVGGDTASAWMSRGQLVLASATTNGRAAPDTLMVGLRAQNNIAFNRKLDAPNVEPDANNTASVTELLGTTVGGNEVVGVSGNDLINGFELTLNAKRYRLKGFNGGKGSGIIRFSGAHGIPEAQWGSNGDSALLLEAFRTSAAAGTTTTSIWDNVTVEADATKMLAEPYWDFQATYDSSGAHSYTIWVPSTEPIIRGVIFIGPGSGEDFRYFVHDPVAQEAARAIGFALIGYQNAGNMRLWSNDGGLIQPAVQTVLDAAAAAAGRPEIANAPLCITGCSAGAFDSSHLARNWPERVVAFVCHRGNDFSNPILAPAAKKVPGLMVAGSTDGNGLTEPFYMQTRFVSWRSQGAQVAYAVDWGVGHTPRGNQGWEGTFTWFVEVANLRYPRPAAPPLAAGAGSPTLIDLSDDSGWLGDRTEYSAAYTPGVTSPFTTVAPRASYAGVVTNASWLPNETCARMYRALTSTDLAARTVVPLQGPPRITSPAQYADPVTAGLPITIDLDPRDFDNTNALASVEFHDGATLLGTDSTGPEWSQTFTPTEHGLHTLTLVATDALGTRRAAMRTLYVVPADFPPIGVAQAHAFGGHTNVSGTVTALDPEGDGGAITFTLAAVPLHGQLLEFDAATGAFTYQPDAGFVGADAFTFAAVSAGVTGPVTIVSFDVTPATPAGVLDFAATTLKVDKTAGVATLTVNRTAAATGAVSTSYATSDSSAADGTHYTAASGTLSWADGDLAPKTFSVPIIDTASPQLPRQFKVALGDPTGGVVLGDRVSAAVLIEDPSAGLDSPWSQTVLGTPTDSSPAVSGEGTLGDAIIGGGGLFGGATSDHGRFIYQSRAGDGMLRMFVPAPTPAQAAGRFAVMVRDTLGSNSMMVAAVTSGDGTNFGAKHVHRTAVSAGATATPAIPNDQSTPRWLRVIRAGNNFATQSSADGTNWSLLGSAALAAMPATANWGIFHCSADLAPTNDLGDYQLATYENIDFGPPPVPATPTNLNAITYPGFGQVIFYWASDSFAAGYRIERRTETGGFVSLGSVSNQTYYNDYAIAADTGYEYRVQAYNAAGDSPWSAGKRITTPPADPLLPTRPSFLTATPGAGSSLDLQWEDNSGDEIGFPLDRRAANGLFAPLETLAIDTTNFTDGTTLPGVLYEYRLRATNVAGNSAWTPIASATAPGTATGYQNWLFANGLPMDASGSGSAIATPASDGLPNLIKYALGLSATANGNSGRLRCGTTTDGGSDYLTLTYIRPDPVPDDITYSVEAGPDLTSASWTSIGLVEISNTVNAGLRTLTLRDSVPLAGASRRFMRLKVTQP